MALTQSIALDKRFKLNGEQVMRIGELSLNNQNYKAAKKAFSYILNFGKQNELYTLGRSFISKNVCF